MKNNKIKRMLAIVLFVAFASTVFAQAVKDKTTDFTINGISSKEDIGGVEVSLVDTGRVHTFTYNEWTSLSFPLYRVAFENYNDFTVTLTYEFDTDQGIKKSGTMFLRAGESKQIGEDYYHDNGMSDVIHNLKMIVRKMGPKD